jgi:tetratricopeptide (TPR) repeat protein
LEHIERAFAIAEPYQDQLVLTTIHAYLAGAHQHLLQFQESMQWSHRLIAFGEQNSDLLAVAIGNEFLAEDYFGLGQWQETLQYADQDRIVAIKIGAQDRIAWAGFSLASGYYGMGDLAKAAEIARSGLELAELIGEKRLEILIGSTLAQIQADMGNHEEALHNARQAQQRGSLLGQLLMSGAGNHALAYCLALQGEWQKSLELMDAVDAELIHTDNGVIPLFYYGFYGMAALEAGEFEKAERITLGNLELTRRAGSRHYEAEATRVLAQIRSAQGKRQGAAQLFTQAMETFTALGSRLELGKAWFYFGQAQSGWGDGVKGGEALQKAGEIFKACGAKYWEKKLKIAD